MRTGSADLPLHPGKCPPWLFKRMKALGAGIAEAIVLEYGQKEFLNRLSDPFWFQGFGCVLGFDWHSSGLTTTVCGALKEGLESRTLGIAVCGGKGKASRKAPAEIQAASESFSLSTKRAESLVQSSRLSAKVDNSALQDGYQLYQHVFFLTEKGDWSVVQQGLNPSNKYARRYHWFSGSVESFVEEPHSGIAGERKERTVLNLVSKGSRENRSATLDLVKENPVHLVKYFTKNNLSRFFRTLEMPRTHFILNADKRNLQSLQKAYEAQPETYEQLLGVQGVGPKTIRSLALISDMVYGAKPDWEDPVKFSFAHGGKDSIPYPVDKPLMDKSIEILRAGIEESRVGRKDKLNAIKRLNGFIS